MVSFHKEIFDGALLFMPRDSELLSYSCLVEIAVVPDVELMPYNNATI